MPKIALDDVTPNNLGVVEKINAVTLPFNYDHSWYVESLQQNEGHLLQLAFVNELPVAALKARAIAEKGHSAPASVYIDSIAVLEAYRGLGLAKKLLDWLVEESKTRFLHKVLVHVWQGNSEAVKQWYLKQGFKEVGVLKDYYKAKGLENPDAVMYVLEF